MKLRDFIAELQVIADLGHKDAQVCVYSFDKHVFKLVNKVSVEVLANNTIGLMVGDGEITAKTEKAEWYERGKRNGREEIKAAFRELLDIKNTLD